MDYWPYESGLIMPLQGKRIAFPDEFLENHSLVLGKTGTGKSNLLAHLIRLYEGAGKTVIVFDPHGELWKFGSENSSIITLSPYSGESQGFLRFNLLSVLPYRNERERIINEDLVVQTVKDIFSGEEAFSFGTWGPRIETIFSILPRLLLKYKLSPTLQDMLDLLLDYYKRKDFMAQLEREEKTQLYSIFNQGYDFISSSLNKMIPLLSSEVSKSLFSSPRDYFDVSKIRGTLYIELSSEYSPPSLTKPFAIMLLYKIWNSAFLGRMKDVVVVMDEFQTVSPHISGKIVTEGRKFSLWALMATQTLVNLSQAIRDELKTNVHNYFLFQLSEEDRRSIGQGLNNLPVPDFHYFNCIVPREGTHFIGGARIAPSGKTFEIDRKFYDFNSYIGEITSVDPSKMDPIYLSNLVTIGLAQILDGRVHLTEDYFSKIGSRGRKGNESIYHRYLISRSYFFFKESGYEVYEGIAWNGRYPDLTLIKDQERIAVECEYSDLNNKKRIEEKKEFFGKVIFATFSSYRKDIPVKSDLLLIPPLGDSSEPEYIPAHNEITV